MFKSRPHHFQLLSKSALTLRKFRERRSLWRWGSTRNRRINRFLATVLAFPAIYMFMEMKTSCPRTAISMDHRHRSRYYCRAHIQSMSNLSARIAGGLFPSLYDRERVPPVRAVLCEQNWMLSLSLILQVRVMQCQQWAPTGRNINLHL